MGNFIPGFVALAFLLVYFLYKFGRPRKRCPKCDCPLPRWRAPQTGKQVFWGGWTCPNCHQEIDVDFMGNPIKRKTPDKQDGER
jgi:hypothetical protein